MVASQTMVPKELSLNLPSEQGFSTSFLLFVIVESP